ncbi:hypothetical protein CKAH01_12440 [Colletotrichum kahawae]|uniref:Uncharacterized protein n=1 Tax=Colletotrichum kahawae TaxID=34407 RepID=A0AAD9YSN2_COLKA|nr:hypothetical protein CKAH01_12440 [Colletotrichum kahawae]
MPLPSFLLWQRTTLYWSKGAAGLAITPSAFALSHLRTLRRPHFPRLSVFCLSTITPLLHRMRGYLSSSVFLALFPISPRILSFGRIPISRSTISWGTRNIDVGASAYDNDMDPNHEVHGTENETHACNVEPAGPVRHRYRLIEIRHLQDEIHQPCCYWNRDRYLQGVSDDGLGTNGIWTQGGRADRIRHLEISTAARNSQGKRLPWVGLSVNDCYRPSMQSTASIPTYRHIDDTDRALPRKHATGRQLIVRRQPQYYAGHALSRPVKQGSSPNPRYQAHVRLFIWYPDGTRRPTPCT